MTPLVSNFFGKSFFLKTKIKRKTLEQATLTASFHSHFPLIFWIRFSNSRIFFNDAALGLVIIFTALWRVFTYRGNDYRTRITMTFTFFLNDLDTLESPIHTHERKKFRLRVAHPNLRRVYPVNLISDTAKPPHCLPKKQIFNSNLKRFRLHPLSPP